MRRHSNNGRRREVSLNELSGYYKWVLTAFLNRGRTAPACHGTVFLAQGVGHGHIKLYVAQAMQRRGLLRYTFSGSGGDNVVHWGLTEHGERLAKEIVGRRR
jgi:hypothetical protein